MKSISGVQILPGRIKEPVLRKKEEMSFSQVYCLPRIINDIGLDIAAEISEKFFSFSSACRLKARTGMDRKIGVRQIKRHDKS